MDDFLAKYYPGIKKQFHEKRIANLKELLAKEIETYNKIYGDEKNS